MRSVALGISTTALAVVLTGCGEEELTGSLWDVQVLAATDACHDTPADYTGPATMTYRLEFEGSAVGLSIGEDQFATGVINGCEVEYQSVVWGEPKDGYDVKWQLFGEATFRPGGDSCSLSEGVDWRGTESFVIVSTEHPDLTAGCTYDLEIEGAYAGTAE